MTYSGTVFVNKILGLLYSILYLLYYTYLYHKKTANKVFIFISIKYASRLVTHLCSRHNVRRFAKVIVFNLL